MRRHPYALPHAHRIPAIAGQSSTEIGRKDPSADVWRSGQNRASTAAFAEDLLDIASERHLSLYQQQPQLIDQMRDLPESPADLAGRLARQNLEWMSEMRNYFLTTLGSRAPSREERGDG